MKVFRISGRDHRVMDKTQPAGRCLNESLQHKRKRLRICFIIERNMRASMKVFRISGRDGETSGITCPYTEPQ